MKRKVGFSLALALIFLLANCAAVPRAEEGAAAGIKGKKEILVARDIDRGGEGFYSLKFCGSSRLLFRSRNSGVGLIDLRTKDRIKLDLTLSDALLNCTPDGRWLLYIDAKSERTDEEIEEENKIEFFPGVYGWLESTYDMYAYDTITDKKTLIASIRTRTEYDVLSPDGTKVLLGERHALADGKWEEGMPQWEEVWFTKRWKSYDATWFRDSTGVITYGEEYSNILCIEFFGPDGWSGCFEQEDSTDMLKTDGEGRLYYLEGGPHAPRLYLNQCEVKDRELKCKRILEDYYVNHFFNFLSNGDIIFQEHGLPDNCIRRATPGGKEAPCVLTTQYGDVKYDGVGLDGVSPDGRWLVFKRYNSTRVPGGASVDWQFDLFVIDLKDD